MPAGKRPLEHVCRLFGYRVAIYPVGNLNELRRTIKFIGAITRLPEFDGDPLLVHISVDGDLDGMEIGPHRATWEQLTLMISGLFGDLDSYSGPVVLVLSAPGPSAEELTGLLLKHR